MEAERWNENWTAVAVVAGVDDILQPRCRVDPAPHMNRVVSLDDVFAPVVEGAIAKKKTVAPKCKVVLVIFRNRIAHESQACAILAAVPHRAVSADAPRETLPHFCEGE